MNSKSRRGVAAQFTSVGVTLSALFVFGLLFTISANASGRPNRNFNVKIKNFGQVDENLYRGGQPEGGDFQALAALGVKTVINLRDDPKDFEPHLVRQAGMQYVNIPMSDSEYPRSEQIERFLKTVNDTANGPYYVHCAGGRHRTGVTVAVYRFNNYGWSADQAYSEMKDYDFYTRWGHGAMKDFVFDYYKQMRVSNTAPYRKSAAGQQQ